MSRVRAWGLGAIVVLALASTFTERAWLVAVLAGLPNDMTRTAVGVFVTAGFVLLLAVLYLMQRRTGGKPTRATWPVVVGVLQLSVFLAAFPRSGTRYDAAVQASAPGFKAGTLIGGVMFFVMCAVVILRQNQQRRQHSAS